MVDIVSNLLSGLVGALIGGFAGIFAVRHSHVLQAEATLRNHLVAQHLAVKMLDSQMAINKLQSDYLTVYQAYQNLRSLVWWSKRSKLDNAWRNYKGDYEDTAPLFGKQTINRSSETSASVTSRSFTHEEVIKKIEHFLDFLS